jgi:hypothetical protein
MPKKTDTQDTNDRPLAATPGSAQDGYDQRLKDWCEKRGLHHGDLHRQETFLDDSEEDEENDDDGPISLCEDFDADGVHVELYDLYGWRARYKVADLRAHCAKHGKIGTWKDFEKLGAVPHEDVE